MSLVGPTPSRAQFSGYPTSWEFDGLLTSGEPVHLRPMLQSDISGLAALAWAAEDLSRSFDAGSLTNDAPHGTEVIEGSQVAFVLLAGPIRSHSGGITAAGQAGRVPSSSWSWLTASAIGGRQRCSSKPSRPTRAQRGSGSSSQRRGREPSHARGSRGHRPALCEQRREWVVRVEIDLRPTPDYRARCDEREATAEAASIAAIPSPTIGRSRRSRAAPGKCGS